MCHSIPYEQMQGRDRVHNIIQTAIKQRLLIVSANSGAGKTTAVEAYLSKIEHNNVLWVTFSGTNSHAMQFWSMFAEALAAWDNKCATELMELGFPGSIQDVGLFLQLLQRAAETVEEPIVVLDNFHLLPDGPVKELIAVTLDKTCEQISYILIGQDEVEVKVPETVVPAFLTNQDLHFTKEEIRTYYVAIGIQCDSKALDEIYELTRGWAIAVSLMGMSLQRSPSIANSNIDNAVTLIHRVFDAELYLGFPDHIQQALIYLSQLEEIHPQMIVQLSMLSQRELLDTFRSIPFLHYNNASNAYSFHPLYRQFLVSKQMLLPYEEQRVFLQRAGRWYEQHGMIIEPVQCYLAAEDYMSIKSFLLKTNVAALTADVAALYTRLLERIPKSFLASHPMLWFCRIVIQLLCGERVRPNEEMALLESSIRAGNQLDTREGRDALGEILLITAYLQFRAGNPSFMNSLREAAELLPDGTRFWDGKSHSFVSNASCLLLGGGMGMTEFVAAYREATPYLKIALQDYGRGVEDLAACEAHFYRNEYEEAMHYAGLAISTAVAHKQWDIAACACYICTRLGLSHGTLEDVNYYRNSCRKYAELDVGHNFVLIADIADWGLYEQMEEYDKAANWIKSPMDVNLQMHHINTGRELPPIVYYLMHKGEYYPALGLIHTAMEICNRTGKWIHKLYLQVLRSQVYMLLGEVSNAIKHLQIAYQMAQRDKIIQPFIHTATGTKLKIIAEARKLPEKETGLPAQWLNVVEDLTHAYIRNVNRMKKDYYGDSVKALQVRLTPREEQIFSLLCAHLEIKEIAETLGVTRNTVKVNLSNIYRKMGVNNRHEAVRMGLEQNEGI